MPEDPRGSFRCQGGMWRVACWECKKGINGNSSCASGVRAKNLKEGCFNGQLLDKFVKVGEADGGAQEES